MRQPGVHTYNWLVGWGVEGRGFLVVQGPWGTDSAVGSLENNGL